jgi:hypothetical protein
MNSMWKRIVIVAALAMALVILVLPAGASPNGQDIVYFDKAYDAAESTAAGTAVFTGTVSGAASGTVKSTLLDARPVDDGVIVLVTFKWEIVDTDLADGDQSFTAVATGTLNNSNGKVVMNGEVVEGYLSGAKFIEQGKLVDPDTSQFQGSMALVINTADS